MCPENGCVRGPSDRAPGESVSPSIVAQSPNARRRSVQATGVARGVTSEVAVLSAVAVERRGRSRFRAWGSPAHRLLPMRTCSASVQLPRGLGCSCSCSRVGTARTPPTRPPRTPAAPRGSAEARRTRETRRTLEARGRRPEPAVKQPTRAAPEVPEARATVPPGAAQAAAVARGRTQAAQRAVHRLVGPPGAPPAMAAAAAQAAVRPEAAAREEVVEVLVVEVLVVAAARPGRAAAGPARPARPSESGWG
jgi:hypothetical protein